MSIINRNVHARPAIVANFVKLVIEIASLSKITSMPSNMVIISSFIVDVETCNSCFNGGTCTRKNGVDTCTCPSNFNYILNLFAEEKCLIIFQIL